VSVQRSKTSISRGQQAAYVVRVSTQNDGSAADVTVALTAQPSSQKPKFTSGCAKGAGTASCTDQQPASLKAQIPVAASATSVTSVKLTATASIVTTEKWTPPSAAETVAVTAASASPGKSPAGSSPPGSSPAGLTPEGALPLGPIPNLNGVSSQLIGAGNASGLFPAISPSASPSPSPGSPAPAGQRDGRPAAGSSAIAFVKPGLTGQVAGLIALAVAVMLTVTRLSLRKRFRSRKQGG
jgi:hypothetical protein